MQLWHLLGLSLNRTLIAANPRGTEGAIGRQAGQGPITVSDTAAQAEPMMLGRALAQVARTSSIMRLIAGLKSCCLHLPTWLVGWIGESTWPS